MPRRQIVEVQCSRCDRKEQAAPEALVDPNAATAFVGEMDDVRVVFEDLCTPCRRTVHALLEQIGKKIEGLSPDRSGPHAETKKPKKLTVVKTAAKKEETPDGTPPAASPKPHHNHSANAPTAPRP